MKIILPNELKEIPLFKINRVKHDVYHKRLYDNLIFYFQPGNEEIVIEQTTHSYTINHICLIERERCNDEATGNILTQLYSRMKPSTSHKSYYLSYDLESENKVYQLSEQQFIEIKSQSKAWRVDRYFTQRNRLEPDSFWNHLQVYNAKTIEKYSRIRTKLATKIVSHLTEGLAANEKDIIIIDIGTGFGQLIAAVQSLLDPEKQKRITFLGIDRNKENIEIATKSFAQENVKFLVAKSENIGSFIEQCIRSQYPNHEIMIVGSGGLNRVVTSSLDAINILQQLSSIAEINFIALAGLTPTLIHSVLAKRLGWNTQIQKGVYTLQRQPPEPLPANLSHLDLAGRIDILALLKSIPVEHRDNIQSIDFRFCPIDHDKLHDLVVLLSQFQQLRYITFTNTYLWFSPEKINAFFGEIPYLVDIQSANEDNLVLMNLTSTPPAPTPIYRHIIEDRHIDKFTKRDLSAFLSLYKLKYGFHTTDHHFIDHVEKSEDIPAIDIASAKQEIEDIAKALHEKLIANYVNLAEQDPKYLIMLADIYHNGVVINVSLAKQVINDSNNVSPWYNFIHTTANGCYQDQVIIEPQRQLELNVYQQMHHAGLISIEMYNTFERLFQKSEQVPVTSISMFSKAAKTLLPEIVQQKCVIQ